MQNKTPSSAFRGGAMPTIGTSNKVFRNRRGDLRAGWRILIYAIVVGLIGLTAAGVSRLLHGNDEVEQFEDGDTGGERFDSWAGVIGFFIMDAILVLAAFVTLRFIDKRPMGMLGLSLSSTSAREFLAGFGIGAGAISVSCCIMWASGALDLCLGNVSVGLLLAAGRFFLVFLAAAAVEELIMRGYPFQVFAEGVGAPLAIIFFGLVFALGHMTNQGWTMAGLANTGLSGILMSLAYLRTRSLWVPIAIHLSWNWTQGCIWGMNVSGVPVDASLLGTTPRGPSILGGGTFGAEGSIFTSAVVVLFCLYLWKAPWLKPSAKNAKLWEPSSG
jgi:membrane protease YdiL (CAAX protease family)